MANYTSEVNLANAQAALTNAQTTLNNAINGTLTALENAGSALTQAIVNAKMNFHEVKLVLNFIFVNLYPIFIFDMKVVFKRLLRNLFFLHFTITHIDSLNL